MIVDRTCAQAIIEATWPVNYPINLYINRLFGKTNRLLKLVFKIVKFC